MKHRLGMLLVLGMLAACAVEEELILIEPVMEEPMVAPEAVDPCDAGDDDGIGGTGCEPTQ